MRQKGVKKVNKNGNEKIIHQTCLNPGLPKIKL